MELIDFIEEEEIGASMSALSGHVMPFVVL